MSRKMTKSEIADWRARAQMNVDAIFSLESARAFASNRKNARDIELAAERAHAPATWREALRRDQA